MSSDEIKFITMDKNNLPLCPFIWFYNDCIYPIIDISKTNHKFITDVVKLFDNVQLSQKLASLENDSTIEYYFFLQQSYGNPREEVHLSPHTWFYYNVPGMNKNVITPQINICNQVDFGFYPVYNMSYMLTKPRTIPLNNVEKRPVHIHGLALSPGGLNVFFAKYNELVIFVSIIKDPTQKTCVTLHAFYNGDLNIAEEESAPLIKMISNIKILKIIADYYLPVDLTI